jgi:hypothetical protein
MPKLTVSSVTMLNRIACSRTRLRVARSHNPCTKINVAVAPTRLDVGKQRQLRSDRREILDVLGAGSRPGDSSSPGDLLASWSAGQATRRVDALVLTRGARVLPTQTERTAPSTKAGCSMATRSIFRNGQEMAVTETEDEVVQAVR